MKLDKYKLLEETDEHFRLDDGSGKPFRVAKKGLGNGLRDRIVQHFAAGGVVEQMPEMAMTMAPPASFTMVDPAMPTEPDAGEAFTFPTPESVTGPIFAPPSMAQPAPVAPAPQPPSGPTVTGAQLGFGAPPTGEIAVTGLLPPAPAPTPTAQPQPQPQPQVAPPATGGAGMPGMTPPPSAGTAGLGAAQKETEAGIRAQGAAVKAQAEAEMRLRQQQEEQRQTLANEYQRRIAEHQARGDALFENILAQKVDPNRLWASKSTGQKLGSLAAIIMSGIGQAFQASGGINAPNMALQISEQAIDRDIDAQKADIAKGQSLLAHHSQGGRDMQTAYQLTKADMLDGFAGQLQRNASQFAGQKSDADVQVAIGAAREKAAQLRAQAANTDFERWYKTQQLGIEAGKAMAPKGLDKDQQKTLTEVEDRYQNIQASLGKLKRLITTDGTWNFTGPHNQILNQQLEAIATDMAKLADPQSIARPQEVEAAKKLLFEPGLWTKDANAQAALDNFMGLAQQRRDTAYRVRGLGGAVGPPSLRQGRE